LNASNIMAARWAVHIFFFLQAEYSFINL
jgi:hypothetical protein